MTDSGRSPWGIRSYSFNQYLSGELGVSDRARQLVQPRISSRCKNGQREEQCHDSPDHYSIQRLLADGKPR